MKSCLLLSVGLLVAMTGWSQTVVMGTVKDTRGRILAGSSVSIKDAYDGGLTDSIGRFRFKT